MMKKFFRRTGFTMAEALIAASLTAFIGMAVLASLRQGVVLWQEVDRPSVASDVALFFEKCAQDMENVFLMDPAPVIFSGDNKSLSCPTSVRSWRYGDQWSMGLVQLSFDEKQKVLTRSIQAWTDIFSQKAPVAQVVFSDVAYCVLSYYFGNQMWVEEWPPSPDTVGTQIIPRWPEAVRMRLGLRREGKVYDFERVWPIPLAR